MPLPNKLAPYTFVPVVTGDNTQSPVFEAGFHDGKNTDQKYTGELLCQLEALTPMLAGYFQYEIRDITGDEKDQPVNLPQAEWGTLGNNQIEAGKEKSLLEPLSLGTDIESSPVIIPGSSIKGMIRHNIGAMLSAPMERVQEQYFSYRPNLDWNDNPSRYECKEAIVKTVDLDNDLLEVKVITAHRQAKFRNAPGNYQHYPYKGGIDGGSILAKGKAHDVAYLPPKFPSEPKTIDKKVVHQYLKTQQGLADSKKGHVSRRTDLTESGRERASNAIKQNQDFQLQQLIYVEIDRTTKKVVSFGRHFRYRWRYADTICTVQEHISGENKPRSDVTSPKAETMGKEGQGDRLTGARLLFGYVDGGEEGKDGDLNLGIGEKDYARLAGRISVNHAVEQGDLNNLDKRFVIRSNADNLQTMHRYTIPLKILGEPRASAVEHYLQQKDKHLQTYGDLPAVEVSGANLNGRKFYRHQPVTDNTPFEVTGSDITSNQTTFARFISKKGSRFHFKVRFKDLRDWELGALILALSPDYRSSDAANKLGHGRPLGLGSVRIDIDRMDLLNNDLELKPGNAQMGKCLQALDEQDGVSKEQIESWLQVLDYKNRKAAEYPRANGHIYTYHTDIRRQYSKKRRDQNSQMDANYGKPVEP